MTAECMEPATQRRKRPRWVLILLAAIAAIVLLVGTAFVLRPIAVLMALQQFSMWRHGIHSEYVRLGPYRIHYLVAGRGRPLVLVHGLGGRSENWAQMIPQFTASGFHVYAPDLLGYGRSDKPDVDYSISLQTDLLRQFLDSRGLQRPDVAGWSMGGWISLKLAADSPQRVRRLILLDSAGLRFDPVNVSALRPRTPEQFVRMMKVLTPVRRFIPGFIVRDTLRMMREEDWVVGRSLASMETGRDTMDGRLQSVTIPVLIVWGREDVLTPLSIGERMQREMPQSGLVVAEGCGHLAPMECQDQVVPPMQKFLTQ